MNNPSTWDDEYEDADAIPSSHRRQASRAVRSLAAVLDHDRIGTVLDMGCGNCRNAIFLAEQGHDVAAIDFSEAAIELARQNVEQADVSDRVSVRQEDVMEGLSCDDGSVDLVLDAYVSCHFLDPEDRQRYWDEMDRVLTEDGAVLWVGMSAADGYYSGLGDTDPRESIVVDPLNDVGKRLYSREELEEGFAPGFEAETVIDISFDDDVDGGSYRRRVLGAVLRHT
jgi:SAM-dependent methyltransferase